MKHQKRMIQTIARRFCLGLFLAAFLSTIIGIFFNASGTQNAYSKKRTYNVTVVGNSLLRTGSQLKYLKQIGKLYNIDIKIYDQLRDGYELSDHLWVAKINGCNLRSELKKADIVIFQEYGTRYETTYKDIVKLQKYMKKSARSYYYMTEFDYGNTSLFNKLQKHGVNIIKAESLIKELYTMDYNYDDLHNYGDYHPNNNNGYTASILMFNTVFNKKCTNYPVGKCPERYRNFLKGNNWKEKKACLEEILKTAERIRKKGKY